MNNDLLQSGGEKIKHSNLKTSKKFEFHSDATWSPDFSPPTQNNTEHRKRHSGIAGCHKSLMWGRRGAFKYEASHWEGLCLESSVKNNVCCIMLVLFPMAPNVLSQFFPFPSSYTGM